ncbi:MAG: biliverdin-producing heme oxygenase [Gemmatimonadales bacterium]
MTDPADAGGPPSPPAGDAAAIMDRLREGTRAQHADAERRRFQRSLVAGRVTVEEYAAWLAQMYLVHRALRQAIDDSGAGCAALRRVVRDDGLHVRHLEEDLRQLGVSADALAPLPASAQLLEAIRNTAASDPLSLLGFNYVLEGSMNGNRFIARGVTKVVPKGATRYLQSYGESQPSVWQAYRSRMDGLELDQVDADRIVDAARRIFALIGELSDQLMPGPPST